MPDNALPSAVEKRVRYFDGQFLQDQDFIDEQNYQLDREHRHNRLLHGPGIAEGLTVTSAAPNQVTVAPGTAIDSEGRQLVLAQATTVDLPGADFNDKQGVELFLSYRENAEDPQTAGGSQDFTRWLERPALTALAPDQTYSGASPVLLAKVGVDNVGRVVVDGTVRPYSGLRLPGSGADPVTLRATSGDRVHLAGSLTVDGNVGVGTASPATKLHVSGSTQLQGDTAVRGRLEVNTPEGGLTVLPTGNVGVGTANPTVKLHVSGVTLLQGDASVSGKLVVNGDPGLNVLPTGNVGVGTANPAAKLHVSGVTLLQGDASVSGKLVVNGQSGLNVLPTGNVGVGTASPTAKLEVVGGGGQSVDLVVNGRLRSDNNDGGLWVASDRFVGGFETNKIGLWNGGFHLAVLPSGNVGVGTTNPTTKLHVNGSTWIQGDTFVSGRIVMQTRLGWMYLHASAFNAPGTGYSVPAGQGADWNGPTGGPSDLRLKTDLRPVNHALGLVTRLQAVRYQWGEEGLRHFTRGIEDTMCAGPGATAQQDQEVGQQQLATALAELEGDRVGFVAQEVEAVLPELVHEVNGYKHIRYQHLTALLAEAIKEQDAVLRALSSEVTALRAGLSGQTA
ncbi:tail fiber domain-containing protein [Streptosporangium sp. NPDC000509]|uniref:tail fiber domain-containing protein n=1 Tax=Streptosporangium sp. NPDC000509 TaxID=3366186 RepID=UPI0036C0144F